ncbi:hypothetical protein ACTXT7_000501 [Hymenolepis weldensis]
MFFGKRKTKHSRSSEDFSPNNSEKKEFRPKKPFLQYHKTFLLFVQRQFVTFHSPLPCGMPKGGNGEPTRRNANKGGTEFEKMEQEEEGEYEEEEGSEDELIEEDGELEDKLENVQKMTKGKNQDKDAEEISRPQVESHQRQGPNAFSVASVVSGGTEGKNEGGDIGAGSSPTGDENPVENEEEEEG